MRQVGVTGKPNVGKSTFFASATLVPVKIANYPFTTVEPNKGIAYVKVKDVSSEFGVIPNPVNSMVIGGWRFVPVELVDLPGLVPGAHAGRGLGNMFLTEVSNADVLIHILDASGSTDDEGRQATPGSWDVLKDVRFLEREYDFWLQEILKRNWDKICKQVENTRTPFAEVIYSTFPGIFKKREYVEAAVESSGAGKNLRLWTEEQMLNFASKARELSKPTLLVANKADLPESEKNIIKLKEMGYKVVPCSAEAELALRRAERSGLVNYIPGNPSFEVKPGARLSDQQKRALDLIESRVLNKWGSTGVQDALNIAYFELLGMVAVYPVQDQRSLTDGKGNVLPDVYLMPRGSTVRDLAYEIHSELGRDFLYAVDCRTMMRLSEDYMLKDEDVVSIVSTSRGKK
ncbi:MAG: redox-regulated ATPase YchF [Thermoproteota archaeon]